jgi:glycosyltransferase involved in cell wall biosynthesis
MTSRPRMLMVAFEFPPCNGASVQRILSVYRGFLADGWDVDVLTAKDYAYENVQLDTGGMIPPNPHGSIVRTMALDVMRHLAFKGKHIGRLINPDRWGLTWIPSATRAGKKLLSKNQYDVIWSSSPTPSPHIVAANLAKHSQAKWVADYRDPMPYLHGRSTAVNSVRIREVDENVYRHSDMMVFATQGIKDMYVDLHAHPAPDTFKVMENGFDSAMMDEQKKNVKKAGYSALFNPGKLSIYYAGVLYSDGRDPTPVFEAVSAFIKAHGDHVELVFQGAGDGAEYATVIEKLGIAAAVKFETGVPFHEAVKNMLSADVLLIIQDEKFNNQVPGKIYEYLASGKPLILKTPKDSQTSAVGLSHAGVWQADNKNSILSVLCDIFERYQYSKEKTDKNNDSLEHNRDVSRHSRQHHVKSLLSWVSQRNESSPLMDDVLQGAKNEVL